MKKLTFLTMMALGALLFTSCNKIEYNSFIGTWGVEKIEYYNIDYAGNPIAASSEVYTYDPNSTDNGIQLIFKENGTGEMRDSAIDSIGIDEDNDFNYDYYIVCPDTVVVTEFDCSYNQSDRCLYMTNLGTMRTFKLQIQDFEDDSFIYENEYDKDYMERAYLKRVSKEVTKSGSRQAKKHPHKLGSFLGDR